MLYYKPNKIDFFLDLGIFNHAYITINCIQVHDDGLITVEYMDLEDGMIKTIPVPMRSIQNIVDKLMRMIEYSDNVYNSKQIFGLFEKKV